MTLAYLIVGEAHGEIGGYANTEAVVNVSSILETGSKFKSEQSKDAIQPVS